MLLYTKERGEEQSKMNGAQLAEFHLRELNALYEFMQECSDDQIIDMKIWYTEWYLHHLSNGNLQIADIYFNLILRARELERSQL